MKKHNETPGNSLDKNEGKDKKTIQPSFDFVKSGIGVEDITAEAEKLLKEGGRSTDAEITGEYLLQANIEQIPCLVEPFLQQVGLACLAGSSDTGKSSLLRQLAISIVTGAPEGDSFLGGYFVAYLCALPVLLRLAITGESGSSINSIRSRANTRPAFFVRSKYLGSP